MISTTPKGQAPIRKPYALDNTPPRAKANVKRRCRPSSEYIAIMKVSAKTPNTVVAFIQTLPSRSIRAARLTWLLRPCQPSHFQSLDALLPSTPSVASPRIHQIDARPASGSARQKPKNWFSSRPALTFREDAGVAQLAEQLFCKQVTCL